VRPVLLAAPRGYCAGVERAIQCVEEGLERWGAPLYVRRQIVHNEHVVSELERAGAVFVDQVEDVPHGATIVFSAHGVSPAVERAAEQRRLTTVDATCPLVTKVHSEVRHYVARGFTVMLIGHAGHDEVEGTTGVAPDAVLLAHHHYPEPHRAAAEILRCLRPGGVYCVVDPGPEWYNRLAAPLARRADPGWISFHTPDQFRSLFAEAGFARTAWVDLLPGFGLAVGQKAFASKR
jgi:SAM-dependent methyltransferase